MRQFTINEPMGQECRKQKDDLGQVQKTFIGKKGHWIKLDSFGFFKSLNENGLSPVWICMCTFRLEDCLNIFYKFYRNVVSNLCEFSCGYFVSASSIINTSWPGWESAPQSLTTYLNLLKQMMLWLLLTHSFRPIKMLDFGFSDTLALNRGKGNN